MRWQILFAVLSCSLGLPACAGTDGATEAFDEAEDALTAVVAKSGPVNPNKTARPVGLQHGPIIAYDWWATNTLARGSQPTKATLTYLADHGFRGIVNLRDEDNSEESEVLDLGMNYLHVPIVDGEIPTDTQMKKFLSFATKAKNTPLLVHCNAGRNRTNTVVAVYEMATLGWSASKAIKEGEDFGLHLANQETYIRHFGSALNAGTIKGFPLP